MKNKAIARWIGFAAGVIILLLAVWMMRRDWQEGMEGTTGTAGTTAAVEPSRPEKAGQEAAVAGKDLSDRQPAEPAATPTPEPGDVWSGRVVSKRTGQPIAGARVSQVDFKTDPPSTTALSEFAAVTSGDGGVFALPIAQAPNTPTTPGAHTPVYLWVEAEGFESRLFYRDIKPGETPPELSLRLSDGGRIAGRVVDESGVGIVGATIGDPVLGLQFSPSRERDNTPAETLVAVTTTDKEGRFSIGGISSDPGVRLPVRAEGYVPTVTKERYIAGNQDIEIILHKATCRLYGRVLDESGVPVADAVVRIQPTHDWETRPDFALMGIQALRTTTDSQGNFTTPPMGTGEIQAIAYLAVGSIVLRQCSLKVELIEGEDREVTFSFPGKVIVTGRVVEDGTNAPIEGVQFAPYPFKHHLSSVEMSRLKSLSPSAAVTSDHEGRFQTAVYPSHGSEVYLYYHADLEYETAGPVRSKGMVVFPMGEVQTELEVRLRRCQTLRGTVFESDGATPARNARVSLDYAGKITHMMDQETDAEGSVTFVVSSVGRHQVTARSPSGYAECEVDIPTDGDPGPFRIILGATASIDGRVKDQSGEAVAGVGVVACQVFPSGRQDANITNRDANPRSITGEDGSYYFQVLPASRIRLYALPDESSDYLPSEAREINLAPGEYRRAEDFTIIKGYTLEGTVKDDQGDPVKDARVVAAPGGPVTSHRNYDVRSDENGRFAIGPFDPDGELNQLRVEAPGFFTEHASNLIKEDSPIEITLRRLHTLDMAVVDASTDRPVARYRYRMSPGTKSVEIDNFDGKALIEEIQYDRIRVDVEELDDAGSPTGRKGSAPMDFEEMSQAGPLIIRVAGGSTVRGRVLDMDSGNPLEGITVALGESAGHASAATNSAGKFEICDVIAGEHWLSATGGDLLHVEPVRVYTTVGEDPPPVDLVMARPASVHGIVTGPEGQPLVGVRIEHNCFHDSSESMPREAITDDQGAYRFDHLSASTHHISYRGNDLESYASRRVTLSPGEDKQLDFDFSTSILLMGRIHINGSPASDEAQIRFSPSTESAILLDFTLREDGNYEARLLPGEYTLSCQLSQNHSGGHGSRVIIEAEPRTQQKDFDINLFSATAVVLFPAGESPVDGSIRLSSPQSHSTTEAFSTKNAPGAMFSIAKAGVYTATFTSTDGAWSGTSAPTQIGPGLENVIVIEVKQNPEQ